MTAKDPIDLGRTHSRLLNWYTAGGKHKGPPDTAVEVYLPDGELHGLLASMYGLHFLNDPNADPIVMTCKARAWIRDDSSRSMGDLPIKAYVSLPAILKPFTANDRDQRRPNPNLDRDRWIALCTESAQRIKNDLAAKITKQIVELEPTRWNEPKISQINSIKKKYRDRAAKLGITIKEYIDRNADQE